MHDSCRNVVHRDIKPDNILFDVDKNVGSSLTRIYEALLILAARANAGDIHSDTASAIFRYARELSLLIGILRRAAETTAQCHSRQKVDGAYHDKAHCNTVTSTELLGSAASHKTNSTPGKRFQFRGGLHCMRARDYSVRWSCCDDLHTLPGDVFRQRIDEPFETVDGHVLWDSLAEFSAAELKLVLQSVSNEVLFALDEVLVVKIADFGFAVVLAPKEDDLQPSVSSPVDEDQPTPSSRRWFRRRNEPSRSRRIVSMPRVATEDVGTKAYAAPEVLNRQPYTTLADLYSLGVLVYECLSCGGLPRRNPATDIHELSEEDVGFVTTTCLDFLRSILTCDDRLSAEAALEHPWISGGTSY